MAMFFSFKDLKSYKSLGSVIPSSPFLYKKMVSRIDFTQDLTLVEFGSGDGVFTRKLLQSLSPNSRLFLFEISPEFIALLQKEFGNDHRVSIFHAGAEDANKYLTENSVDYILSSLPFGLFPQDLTDKILQVSLQILKKDGYYIQYQYFLQNRKDIQRTFGQIDYGFSFINIPPAFVYFCTKKYECHG